MLLIPLLVITTPNASAFSTVWKRSSPITNSPSFWNEKHLLYDHSRSIVFPSSVRILFWRCSSTRHQRRVPSSSVYTLCPLHFGIRGSILQLHSLVLPAIFPPFSTFEHCRDGQHGPPFVVHRIWIRCLLSLFAPVYLEFQTVEVFHKPVVENFKGSLFQDHLTVFASDNLRINLVYVSLSKSYFSPLSFQIPDIKLVRHQVCFNWYLLLVSS